MQPFKSKFFPTNGFGSLSVPWSPTLDFLHVLVASSQVCHLCLIKKKQTKKKNLKLSQNKILILWQDKKNVKKNFLCPLASSLPCAEHCVSALCIDQTSPISRNTCSVIKNNILLAPARQLLKRYHYSSSCEGPQWHLDLDCVNCH